MVTQDTQAETDCQITNFSFISRYDSHLGGYNNAVRIGQEYARRARMELDIDEPTIEGLQTLLLLCQASYQAGKGKKSYMLLSKSHHLIGGDTWIVLVLTLVP